MLRIKYLNIFILGISLLVGKGIFDNTENYDSHINAYSHVNQTHHDNIDDTEKEHVHCHKHTEDGEEHEHKHEHSKLNQLEVKVLVSVESIKTQAIYLKQTQGFKDKNLISSPHLLQIFRPPIA